MPNLNILSLIRVQPDLFDMVICFNIGFISNDVFVILEEEIRVPGLIQLRVYSWELDDPTRNQVLVGALEALNAMR